MLPYLKTTTTGAKLILFGLLICMVGLTTRAEESQPDQRVELGIYFESKCPDSRNFFLNQLIPTYRVIGNETIKPLLVPFGHARVLNRDKMICQHGQRECEGNKLMACMLGQGSTDSEVLEAIGCIFENRLSPKECIGKHMPKTPFSMVDQCAKDSARTYDLMLAAEKMTGRVGYIPHLTVNRQTSEEIQSEAEFDLKNLVCKTYKGVKPEACKSSSAPSQES